MPDTPAHALTASEAVRKIREGLLTSTELVTDCLDHIGATDGDIGAWTHIDREFALAQADHLDGLRRAGKPLGALHGVPVGLKDIIDTKVLLTERGSPVFRGRRPESDAALVERLREAGAVLLGKTATTEFAFVHPAETRNPHDTARTPGGSSAGSAASVAAGHVPLAIGTQTNGSVIRPAAFCGTYGFKPTAGIISRTGLLQTSETLDQVGVFSRSIEDTALLADAIKGYDQRDAASYPRPRPAMRAGIDETAPAAPEIVWIELPFNNRLQPDARSGIEEVMDGLADGGAQVERIEAPGWFGEMVECQRIIHEFEINKHLSEVFANHWDQISPTLQPVIERARKISVDQYQSALGMRESSIGFFDEFFNDYDAIIAPSAPGEAPLVSTGHTGDPVFSTIWTACGLPCLTLPLLVGENGLPVGVQLIGGREEDARLMRTANWLLTVLSRDAQ